MTDRELLTQIRKFIISGGDTISMIAMIDRVLIMNEDEERYMPPIYRLRRELSELLEPVFPNTHATIANKIEEIVTAMIEEDRYDRSPDRQED